MECFACGSGTLQEMGQLGRYMNYRCRNCGAETRQQVPGECDKCDGSTYFVHGCAAEVCDDCDHHKGLARCWCGWSASGGDGRRELVEMGETIDPE